MIVREGGEANFFDLLDREGHWIAQIQFNGELTGDKQLTMAKGMAKGAEDAGKINDLRKAILEAKKALVELNLGNYNDDDVREEQAGMLAAWQILTDALDHEGESKAYSFDLLDRGDHTHVLPDGWTSGATSGAVPEPVQPAPSGEDALALLEEFVHVSDCGLVRKERARSALAALDGKEKS